MNDSLTFSRTLAFAVLTIPVLVATAATALAGPPRETVRFAHPQRIPVQLDTLRSRVWFEADATLGKFTGTARRVRGHAEIADTADFTRATGRIEIDAASFRTGIGMRDGHLRDELEVSKYPMIVFALADANRSSEDAVANIETRGGDLSGTGVILMGTLTIKDVTRDVGIPARIRFTRDSLYARGRVPIRFTDFDMKPPTRMLGTTKVRDDLVLQFDAVFAVAR
ncbi:MAG: YceI family protein [Longimicrobiales bacterium]